MRGRHKVNRGWCEPLALEEDGLGLAWDWGNPALLSMLCLQAALLRRRPTPVHCLLLLLLLRVQQGVAAC